MRRVVSVYLPHWSTDRLRRKTRPSPPEVSGTLPAGEGAALPLVTALHDHGRRVIAAVDQAALRLGVTRGMTLTKARSFAGALDVVDADAEADLAGLKRLALWAGERYSPFVAPDPPDGLWLDITGCAHLFDAESALVKDLHRRLSGFGLSVQTAVADTAGCAHAVARHVPAGRPVTIEPGDHRTAMRLLPVAALRLDPEIVDGLRKLGFDRIEQLMASPRGPLAKRFGRMLHRRLDQALGSLPEPIEPIFPDHLPSSRRGMLEPIMTAQAFAHVIGDLVQDIIGQLVALGKGARRLDCYFHRVDGHTQAIRVGTARASRDHAHLSKLVAAKIDTIDPGLGIEAMTLVAPLVDSLFAAQGETLDNLSQSSGRRRPDLAPLVDALANRFGQRTLYRAMPNASAMPERSVGMTAALGPDQTAAWDLDLPRPCRMLDTPEPVDVTAMLPDHPPAMFIWRGRRFRIVQADGPERLHGEWWRDAGQEARVVQTVRDYFQVETEGGGRYWLFRLGDGVNPATGSMRWFIHGAFA